MAIRAEEIAGASGSVDLDRDRVLVFRHQDGDEAAFDELYRRYRERLVAYCQRRVRDRHVAEELAQEAFVRAFRAMPRFAGERRFYPWMTVIAGRLCIDHHRRTARVEPAAELDPGVVEADHDALWDAVDRHHVRAAVERLAPRHREVLDLREHRGWSYQQIAAHLEVPLTTVEALLHRARKALRREYLAVAGDDAGRLVAAGGLTALLAKAKGWLAALTPERALPVLGSAAAGVAAIGLSVAPLALDQGTGDATRTSPEAEAVLTSTDAGPAFPATTAAPVTVSTTARAPVAVVETPADTETAPIPPPSVDLGVAAWYPGPEGDAYVDDQIDCMPVALGLQPLANVGIDPGPVIDPLLGALTQAPEASSEVCP